MANKLLKNLSTDWAYINEKQLTVVAWKLQLDIKTFSVYTLQRTSACNNFWTLSMGNKSDTFWTAFGISISSS